jgi:hypothetical protein
VLWISGEDVEKIARNAKIAKKSKLKAGFKARRLNLELLKFSLPQRSKLLRHGLLNLDSLAIPAILTILFLLCHHNIVLCRLALRGGIHCGHADQVIFFGVELYWWLFYLGWDSGKFGFALCVGVDTHIELVRAKCTVRQMDVDSRRVHWLAVGVSHGEFDRARTGSSVGNGNVIRLLGLGGLL